MFCYNCGCHLSEHDFCTSCGVDVSLYKRIMYVSNMYYNEGLAKAELRDLTGAVTSLRQSLKFNKNNIEARNLLGLVYFEMGEAVAALSEWVISKNLRPEKNIADDYINMIQANGSRLDTINQTIKKYNQALVYCMQDSKDLAVIQLRKVLSLNPKFIRAHQLLALLYIDSEQWDKAKRELVKCTELDRNNVQTLTYMKEVDRMLAPDETGKVSRRKEESVRYQADNEIIIQPMGVKEPRRSGVGTLLNIGLGLIIGAAAMYFLVVPAVRTNVNNESQQKIMEISNQITAKENNITELESQIELLKQEQESLHKELDGYAGTDGTLQAMDQLLVASTKYISSQQLPDLTAEDQAQYIQETADILDQIKNSVVLEENSESFQSLYNILFTAISPQMSQVYYNAGMAAYNAENYGEAITALERAMEYNPEYGDACFSLGQAYRLNGNNTEAIAAYEKFVELLPNTERANRARRYITELSAQ